MNPITVQFQIQPTEHDDPMQLQLVVVPASEIDKLRTRVDVLEKQNRQYQRQLDSLYTRLFELTNLFGDFRKGRL